MLSADTITLSLLAAGPVWAETSAIADYMATDSRWANEACRPTSRAVSMTDFPQCCARLKGATD